MVKLVWVGHIIGELRKIRKRESQAGTKIGGTIKNIKNKIKFKNK
jgi:hypothetical protein